MNAPQSTKCELAEALRLRRSLIFDHAARDRDPAAHLASLGEVSMRIETLAQSLPAPVEPQLAHFLERHSYDKALAMLEGSPAGSH